MKAYKSSAGEFAEYPVAPNTTIRLGEAVGVNANGEAVGLTGANARFLGVAESHTSAPNRVTVRKRGLVRVALATGHGFTAGSIGAPVYYDGYSTAQGLALVHSSNTGRTQIGTLVELDVADGTAFIQLSNVS